jgi:hypothetical protein
MGSALRLQDIGWNLGTLVTKESVRTVDVHRVPWRQQWEVTENCRCTPKWPAQTLQSSYHSPNDLMFQGASGGDDAAGGHRVTRGWWSVGLRSPGWAA